MWCALLLDSNWCDVWYNGRIVDGFENSHDANEFNVSPTLQRYLDQGAGLTIYGAAGSATVDSYTAPNGVRASLLGK